MLKKLLVPLVLVAVVAGAGLWWFVLRDDAPGELSVGEADDIVDVAPPKPGALEGDWLVSDDDEETVAGFRIDETLVSGLAEHTAVGRSSGVSGRVVIDGTTIAEGSFTVNMTELEFTDDPGIPVANRANAMKSRGLETDTFPVATLELTAPVDFGEVPAADEVITAEVTGNLTLHGVTNEVTFEVEARLAGDTIRVATKDPVPVVLADYDIDKPSAPVVEGIADEGSFEFLVILVPG